MWSSTLFYCLLPMSEQMVLPNSLKISCFTSNGYTTPKYEVYKPSGVEHFGKQNPLCIVPTFHNNFCSQLGLWYLLSVWSFSFCLRDSSDVLIFWKFPFYSHSQAPLCCCYCFSSSSSPSFFSPLLLFFYFSFSPVPSKIPFLSFP